MSSVKQNKMNREIKFRAWDKHKKTMWSVGVLGIFDNCSWQHSFGYLHNTQDWYGEEGMVINPILMQFTGLKDKNGKEIYEGDILLCKTATEPEENGFICLFKDFRWKFNNVNFIEDDIYGTVNYNYISQETEIIGNVYENPELLKK